MLNTLKSSPNRNLTLTLLLRLRAPPHVKANLPPSDAKLSTCGSESDCTDTQSDLDIPDHASVNFFIFNGKPGLDITTRNTNSWTPVAARTRAKFKS